MKQVTLLLLFALSGCTIGSNFLPPRVPAAAEEPFVSTAQAVDAATSPPDRWWSLYDDPAIDRLVTEALAANTDLRVAIANLAVSRGILREAQAGRFPTTTLSGGASYGRNSIADGVAAGFKAEAGNDLTTLGGADVSYEFDLFGRVSRSIEAARADAEATLAARDAVRVVVAAETTRAYAAACSAGAELVVARESLRLAEDSAAIVERQRAVGAASNFDAARARAVVAQTQSTLPALEGRRRAAVFELAALLGRPPAEAPTEAATCEHRPALKASLPVGDGRALLARRPDVRQAERRIAAATARIGVATAALYPSIRLGANFGYASNDTLRGSNALTVSVGPLVSWSFPNIAVARARIAQNKALTEGALASFDGTVLRALKEVEQALSAYAAELDRHAALSRAADEARTAQRLAAQRRQAGALSQLDLLTTEQAMITADTALAQSDTRLVDAQVTLFKALGGGWQNLAP